MNRRTRSLLSVVLVSSAVVIAGCGAAARSGSGSQAAEITVAQINVAQITVAAASDLRPAFEELGGVVHRRDRNEGGVFFRVFRTATRTNHQWRTF
jgi:ABC-type glycerol-3-phosphate transport system substrate-binding protein